MTAAKSTRAAEFLARKTAEAAARLAQAATLTAINSRVEWPAGWPAGAYAAPNALLRTPLFCASRLPSPRPFVDGVELPAPAGLGVFYKGQLLDQDDGTLWFAIAQECRRQDQTPKPGPGGCSLRECCVTSYQLLQTIRLTDTGPNRDSLEERIARMLATALKVRKDQQVNARDADFDSLIFSAKRRDGAGQKGGRRTDAWTITLEQSVIDLFAPDGFTLLDWPVRLALRGSPLAQWLHLFYSTHAAPLAYGVDTLLELAGSRNKSAGSAAQNLRKALAALRDACVAHGQKFDFAIVEGNVLVTRSGSRSQQRHRARAAVGGEQSALRPRIPLQHISDAVAVHTKYRCGT